VTLFIKYIASDTGTPTPCAGTDPVWLAHSIRLTLADAVNTPISKARVNVPCRIHVFVDSTSATYTPSSDPADNDLKVRVQAWVCRPGTAGVGPGTAIASSPTQIQNILGTVAPGLTGTTFFDWTPQPGDLPTGATETHLCIGANCFWTNATGDPAAPPPEGGPLVAPATIDICSNRHHAQRNITLLSATAPGSMAMQFIAGGLEEGGEVEIRIREVRGRRELLPVEQEFLVADGVARLLKGEQLVLAGGKKMPIYTGAQEDARVELRTREEAGERLRLRLKPGELVPVEIHLELPEDEPGLVRAFDVVQEGREGEVIGGLRLLTVAALEEDGRQTTS
jgi:hypothetical protein